MTLERYLSDFPLFFFFASSLHKPNSFLFLNLCPTDLWALSVICHVQIKTAESSPFYVLYIVSSIIILLGDIFM